MTDKTKHPRITAIETASKQLDKARKAVEQAIFDAYRDPTVKRGDIADASPWTPAHVRKLVRDEGIGPDPAYAKRTETARKRAAEHATPDA
jgi:hypothetical protein